MKNKEIRRLYHGSDVYFDVFDRSGVRSTSALGQGYYTTPTLSKAQQYGDCVMEFDVDVTDFLDWDNMTEKQLESIKSVLLQNVPVAELERFNDFLYEVLPLNKDGLVRLEELQRLTSHSDFDVVKAKMIPKSEYPTEFRGLNSRTHGLVRWKQGGSLEGATIENLLNLTQTYVPELARHLGYKGAMYGNEVAAYDPSLLTRVYEDDRSHSLTDSLLHFIDRGANADQIHEKKRRTMDPRSP